MKRTIVSIAVIALALGFTGPAMSDGDFVVYPAKGQSQDQTGPVKPKARAMTAIDTIVRFIEPLPYSLILVF